MNIKERITLVVEATLQGLNLQLHDLVLKNQNQDLYIQVFINKDEGVTIGDCQIASKHIRFAMSGEDDLPKEFYLEVSSPGVKE